MHSVVPVNYKGTAKSRGQNISQLSTVCLADDKTLHSVTSIHTVDTAYRPRKPVFTVQSYQTCLGVLGNLLSLFSVSKLSHPLSSEQMHNIFTYLWLLSLYFSSCIVFFFFFFLTFKV